VITPLLTRDACVLTCDRSGCQDRIEALSAREARVLATAYGWSVTDRQHLCPGHQIRAVVDYQHGQRMGWW
jgi:hypothetical protein